MICVIKADLAHSVVAVESVRSVVVEIREMEDYARAVKLQEMSYANF